MSVLNIYNADNTNNLSSKNQNILYSNTVNVSDKNDNTFKVVDSTCSAWHSEFPKYILCVTRTAKVSVSGM